MLNIFILKTGSVCSKGLTSIGNAPHHDLFAENVSGTNWNWNITVFNEASNYMKVLSLFHLW